MSSSSCSSILVLPVVFLIVCCYQDGGVRTVDARHLSFHVNDAIWQPIRLGGGPRRGVWGGGGGGVSTSRVQERRICAELCMAGLGGEPCGDDCLDVIPGNIPLVAVGKKSRVPPPSPGAVGVATPSNAPNYPPNNGFYYNNNFYNASNYAGAPPFGDGANYEFWLKNQNSTFAQNATGNFSGGGGVDLTRRDACPVLCANRLGYPLCNCEEDSSLDDTRNRPFFRVNYQQICKHFCTKHDYQIYGCDTCDLYKEPEKRIASSISSKMLVKDLTQGEEGEDQEPKEVDWNAWCMIMCQDGDGGTACYCDLLPMSILVK